MTRELFLLAMLGLLGLIAAAIVYLALQVRQNTRTMKAAARLAQEQAYAVVVTNIVQSPTLASAWYRGLEGLANLNDKEVVMFLAQANLLFRVSEGAYFNHKSEYLDSPLWTGLSSVIKDFMTENGIRQFWERRRHWYHPEFQDWVENSASGTEGGLPLYDRGEAPEE
ncbi:MAG: hypothetical protein V3R73_03685 [Sphingomonadales bacterium]